jgi:hypothetical protein
LVAGNRAPTNVWTWRDMRRNSEYTSKLIAASAAAS